jgi:uncharacterized protein (DUF1778 family)
MAKRTAYISVTVEPEIKELVLQAAALEKRTVSDLAQLLLIEQCTRIVHGKATKPE